MRYVIGALLAASMLAPIAAQAQRNDGPERRGDWRGDRRGNAQVDVGVDAEARVPGPRGGGREDRERGPRDDRAGIPRTVDRDVRPGPVPGNAPVLVRGQDDRRPDAGGPDRRGFEGRRDDRDGRWNGQGGDGRARDDRQWAGQPRPGAARDDGRRNDWTRSRIDDRSRFDDRRGYGYDTGYNRGYDSRRNDWDRSWRGQSRYDWTRYRTSNRNAFHLPRYYAPSGGNYGYRRFGIGISLSSALWGRNYWIADPYAYRLPEVYGPYRWVRYYDDALLVDLESGQVVDAVYGIFW